MLSAGSEIVAGGSNKKRIVKINVGTAPGRSVLASYRERRDTLDAGV
jgi:hypothetical protein